VKKQVVAYGVKDFGEVEQNKQSDHSLINSPFDVIGQLDQYSLSTCHAENSSRKDQEADENENARISRKLDALEFWKSSKRERNRKGKKDV